MADKPRREADELDAILDGLAEYVENAPADALLEDARQDGRDTKKIAAHVKGILQMAVKNYEQRELTKAKEAYAQEVASMATRRIELPTKPKTRRSWLAAVFQQQPQLQAALTMQNREFAELTDHDVEAHLRKLELLGVLKDVKLPEDDD
jgi:hypothetical protein